MNKFKLFFIVILFFLISNLIIAFLWSFKTTIKFSNYTPYSEEFRNSLNLSKSETLKLYLETWQRERLFEYDEFTGLKESLISNGTYVNISEENGRLVKNNPKDCKKNIFFYGGEKTFGYDVTDNQSIPYFFREMLEINFKNHCVFNFGRRTYSSTQENILLQKHLLKSRLKKSDMIIFLDGKNENGNNKILNTKFINDNYNKLHQKYWKLGIAGTKYFFDLLPIKQLSEVLFKRFFNKKSQNSKIEISDDSLKEMQFVYRKNLKIRKGICSENDLVCFNFLLFISNNDKNKKKYEMLKNEDDISDLTNFKDQKYLVNRYESLSPNSNKMIAKKIFEIVIE